MAQDIGLLLRGLGAAFSNTVPQFRQEMAQEQESQYLQGQRQQQAQMQNAEMLQARQSAMYKDAESALKLMAAGDLDSVVALGQERLQLLGNFADADPSDTARLTQFAMQARAGDRNAYNSLSRELLSTVQRGLAMGVLTPPEVKQPESYTLGPGQRRFEGVREVASVPALLQGPSAVVNVGGEGSPELNKLIDQQAATYLSAGSTAASLYNDLNLLSQLAPLTSEGAIPAAISSIYPTYNDANAAFRGIISQALPKLKVPGSGSQSDKDVDVLIDGIGPLAASNETKQLLVQAMIQKNQIDQKRADIAQKYATQEIDRTQYLREIRAVDSQSIISEPLRAALGSVMGIPRTATDAGITPEEWNAMTPEGQASFSG